MAGWSRQTTSYAILRAALANDKRMMGLNLLQTAYREADSQNLKTSFKLVPEQEAAGWPRNYAVA